MDRPYGISDFAFPTRWDRESGTDLVERAGRGSHSNREKDQPERDTRGDCTRSRRGFDRSRTIYRGRDREYSLRESEVRTLTDLGKFRVVPEDDLARFGYQGNRTQMEGDVRNLTRQGLVERRSIEGHSSYATKVLTLTKDGHKLLERAQLVSNRQATGSQARTAEESNTSQLSDLSENSRRIRTHGAKSTDSDSECESTTLPPPAVLRSIFLQSII